MQCAPRPARGWIPCGGEKSQKEASHFFHPRTEIPGRPAHRDSSGFLVMDGMENRSIAGRNGWYFDRKKHILREGGEV